MKSIQGRWGETFFIENDLFIAPSLINYGEFSPDETETIIKLAEEAGKDKLCLDIGANFGCISQALEYNGFICEAFEPQPDVFAVTGKNVMGRVHNTALGEVMGTMKMAKFDPNAKTSNYGGLSVNTTSKFGEYDVSIIPLDALCLDNIGFMKIDVEGSELNVLKGAKETIERCRPIMYIEDDRKELSPMLRKYLWDIDYATKLDYPSLFRKDNFFKNEKSIWKQDVRSLNLICRPL